VRVFNPRMDRTADIRNRRSRHQFGVNGRDTTGRRRMRDTGKYKDDDAEPENRSRISSFVGSTAT
jgi:hypothetical protein